MTTSKSLHEIVSIISWYYTHWYIYQICVIWYSECCIDYYFITVDQPELAFGQNLFLLLRLRCFFLSLQRISRLALEWIKTKITWEYHWSVDLNRKTGKKHEHGGLLCFIAVNSACVMTKELSWIKVCFGASDNQLTFRAQYALFCWLSQTLLCSVITTHLSVFNSEEG